MELIWNPIKPIASSESIQFIDNRNFRKDVNVVFKSIGKPGAPKSVTRFPNVSTGTTKQPMKMVKSASSHTITTTAIKPQPLSNISKSDMNISKMNYRSDSRQHFEKIGTLSPIMSPNTSNFPIEKENVSPATPKNGSDLFDTFKFTPATETKTKQTSNLEILSSMATPVLNKKSEQKSVSADDVDVGELISRRPLVDNRANNVPERTQWTSRKSPRWTPKIVRHSCTPPSGEKSIHVVANRFDPHIVSTASKRSTPEHLFSQSSLDFGSDRKRKLSSPQNIRPIVINKTFDLSNESARSADGCNDVFGSSTTMDKTTTQTPRVLSIIDEEEKLDFHKTNDPRQILQMTYDQPDASLLRDVQLVGTPLRKCSESMKDLSSNKMKMATQGSMPNLNEMQSLKSIEQNRYYMQMKIEADDSSDVLDVSGASTKSTTTMSTQELYFDQQEILAHSSRFNIAQVDKQSQVDLTTSKRSREPSVDSPSYDYLTADRYHPDTGYTISVSPPKKSRLDIKEPYERPGTKIRVTKWSAVQPKKLKLIRPQSKPLISRKIKLEPGVKLYDSEMYLQSYINPDAFAATVTFDPFLASTMYLDDQSIKKHEQQMMKWLNALVALPAELDTDCSKKVDVGQLFNLVRNKDLILAPTKEEHSMNYLTKARMEALRKAAVNLYLSHEMIEVCSKVAILINKNSIELRKDRDLHLDVVLQRYILELLLSFNPLWLRLGLEVVFGEIIHLHSNSDIVGLSTFILNRLFRDRVLEQKHPKAYHLSEQYSTYIKKFTLQQFLFLLLFLDKAKNKKIIKHNPCLFVANSKYKETRDILLKFSCELLSNVGDITRNLKRHGYVLTHKQMFIDEFNYAFKNLAVDLRDGIRLTRVMEIILLRDDLTSPLRVPAISRTQKAFNVNLALKALAEANFTLSGGITAYDIVDGHREKTLSLLWQIIYKFRSPKFQAAATTIQRWWRKCWLRVFIKRRIRMKIEMKRNEAACKIQSAFRGFLSRKRTEIWKRKRVAASITLQKFIRGFVCRRRFHRTIDKIILLQHWYRAVYKAKIERERYILQRTVTIRIQTWYRRIKLARKLEKAGVIVKEIKQQAKLEYAKAIIIQKTWKSFVIRRKFQSTVHRVIHQIRSQKVEYKSAARIQSYFKMLLLRKQFLIRKQHTIQIQRMWRKYKLTQNIRSQFLRQKTAAITIQKYFRGYLAMKKARRAFVTIRTSAIVIQRRYRETQTAKLQRKQFLLLKQNAINIQRRFRATLLMKEQRKAFVTLKKYTTIIQQRYRAKLLMRKYREDYIKLKNVTTKIQIKLRATLLARKVRFEYLTKQFHAIIIQQHFRAKKSMQKDRSEFLRLKAATILVQRQFRAKLLMSSARSKFLKEKQAAIIIQTRFRAQKLMKIHRYEYLTLKSSAIIIQQRFRATMLMRKHRIEYLHLRQAVIKIQRYYRAILLMRTERSTYLKTKRSAINIQARYRALIAMRSCKQEYLAIKSAAIIIQNRFRATKKMKSQRNYFLQLRNATVALQRRYRANKLMQQERAAFVGLKAAAIVLQHHFRARNEMRRLRKDFLALKDAAVVIQSKFRARQAMREAWKDYSELKKKTILIQRFIRSYQLTKRVRQEFLLQRHAALTIQNWWQRTKHQQTVRTIYLQTIKSISIIQIRWRAIHKMRTVRREYLSFRTRVVQIQRYIRATLAMRSERNAFLKLKQAAITIQRKFRARQLMLDARHNFFTMKHATMKIQQWFRAIRITKVIRENYLELRKATVFVQQKYRARKLANTEHKAFLQIRETTVGLQQHIRGLLARRRFNELLTPERREEIRRRKAVKIIQKYWRGYAIRKRWHSVEFQLMRSRIKEARANFKPANAIRNLVVSSVQRLKQRYQITELLSILIRLENLSRVVPHTLKQQASFIASFAYGIMAQANRSEPDKQVIELCSRIILNFARYPATKEDVFQESGLVTIAQMLLRWSDKDCPIFNTLCTLIWVFIHCEEKKEVIYNFMTTRESTFMVRETKKLVLRKDKMRAHSRKLSNYQQYCQQQINSPKHIRQALPHLESDFGVVKKAPYVFNCSIFALDTILTILSIRL